MAIKLIGIMATVFCDNCGTSLLDENAKYCRVCGKPTPVSDKPIPESEAATKRFDEPSATESSTRPVGAYPTGPAYLSPSVPQYPVLPSVATNDLRQKSQKRNLIIIGSMLAVMIFALAGLLIFLNFGVDSPDGGATSGPPFGETPKGPPGISVPEPPPAPPAPPVIGTPVAPIDPSLIYPGAKQTMFVTEEGGKTVLGLDSNDAAKRVADWYIARLKVAKKFEIVGQTILEAEDLVVMVMGSDSGSKILITRGDKNK